MSKKRADQAHVLREDLEVDKADREREIDEDLRRLRADLERSGQMRLAFGEAPRIGTETANAQHAALNAFVAERRREIDDFEVVNEPQSPTILGALFLVPAAGGTK